MGKKATDKSHVYPPWVHEDLHQELSPEGSSPNPHRREALSLYVERMWVEIRPFGRADPSLP